MKNFYNSDTLCKSKYIVWLNLTQWFQESSNKCEKFTDGWTNGRTDDREHAQKSSLEILIQASLSDLALHFNCS